MSIIKKIRGKSLKDIIGTAQYTLKGMLARRHFEECGDRLHVYGKLNIIKKDSTILVGNNVSLFKDARLSAYGTDHHAVLKIGDNSNIGDRTEIHCGKEVTIGNGCLISWDVVIMDWDHHRINSEQHVYKPVVIEDKVWIGCKAVILKGVTIGTGAIVAAGSVVTHNVPPHSLAAGNPAVIIKENIYWK